MLIPVNPGIMQWDRDSRQANSRTRRPEDICGG
jgi:hypothetical protein